ncbi:hypothetical protein [Pseudoxanthomonas sp. 3HH-4]|uniref:hypothetical protein n=1 Tax=Pseudoxanthomonas sp. 3HH-4 TaxID=1690214 RepID=UPI00114E8D3F|nr:hypothetical protein [Pseudoxanthomonas sp. 3HH-4]
MFRRLPKAREKYVSLERAADTLRLDMSQLSQFLVTGQLLASIVYHKPFDYREQRDVTLSDGSTAVHTKTSRAEFRFIAPGHEYAQLVYLHREDTARILLNRSTNREMLVARLFYDSTITPKHGIGLLGESAIAILPSDLVISSEELGRFAKAAKIRIRSAPASSIDLPQKPWYDRPIGRTWLAIIGTVVAGLVIMRFKGEL